MFTPVLYAILLSQVFSQRFEPKKSESMNRLIIESNFRFNAKDPQQRLLHTLLQKNIYDKNVRPENVTDRVALVKTSVHLHLIEHVSTDRQEFKVQFTLRHLWNDQRLKYDIQVGHGAKVVKYLRLENPTMIWRPDTFVVNSKQTHLHSDIMPNVLIRIYPNGDVQFATRLTSTVDCPMDLKKYPFDTQTCSLKLSSYSLTTDELVYVWQDSHQIQVDRHIRVKDFTFDRCSPGYCRLETNTGQYSCLKVVIHLKRQSSTYKTKWVVPTAVLTFLSFVSFWVKPNRPLRVGVLLTTAGALYLHVIYISSHSPTIPYSNAKDCWLSACALFIMAALIEYVIVRLFNRNVGRVTNQECKGIDHNSNELRNCHKNIHNGNKDGSQLRRFVTSEMAELVQWWKKSSVAARLDLCSGILFPIVYTIHIIIYFGCYS